jgi:hypothetical protein
MREDIDQAKDKMRVASLSKNTHNFLLWSHYADGHKGIAIEIYFEILPFVQRIFDWFLGGITRPLQQSATKGLRARETITSHFPSHLQASLGRFSLAQSSTSARRRLRLCSLRSTQPDINLGTPSLDHPGGGTLCIVSRALRYA